LDDNLLSDEQVKVLNWRSLAKAGRSNKQHEDRLFHLPPLSAVWLLVPNNTTRFGSFTHVRRIELHHDLASKKFSYGHQVKHSGDDGPAFLTFRFLFAYYDSGFSGPTVGHHEFTRRTEQRGWTVVSEAVGSS
jgi:hypothetical protein